MPFFTYILQSLSDSSFYIGQTKDLQERFLRHNNRRSLYTKARGPWRLVYWEEFSSRELAIRRERELKKKRSKEYLELLIAGH